MDNSVLRVTGLNVLCRIGNIYFLYFYYFLGKLFLFSFWKVFGFKMHKIIFFSEYLKIILGFTSKFR